MTTAAVSVDLEHTSRIQHTSGGIVRLLSSAVIIFVRHDRKRYEGGKRCEEVVGGWEETKGRRQTLA